MALKRFTESFNKDWGDFSTKIEKLPLQEGNHTILVEGVSYPVNTGYLIPVWRLGKKNLNERIYPVSLGEKVCRESKVTLALKDHPEDDGSVDRIVAVCKNPRIRENILWVEVYFVDKEFQEKVEKIRSLGGSLGVSSSGLGELGEDNTTVITESFVLERYLDFVMSPSYEVYLTPESLQVTDSVANPRKESIQKSNNSELKEDLTINRDKEKLMSGTTIPQTMLEKNLRLNLKGMIERAEKLGTVSEKVGAYKEILSSIEEGFLSDIKESVTAKLESLQLEAITAADQIKVVEARASEVESLQETVKTKDTEFASILKEKEQVLVEKQELTEKLANAEKLLSEMKEYTQKMTEMLEVKVAEANSAVSAKDYHDLLTYCEKIDAENRVLKSKLAKTPSQVPAKNKKESVLMQSSITDDELEDPNLMVEDDDEVFNPDDFEDEPWEDEDDLTDDDELELDIYNTADVEAYYNDLISSDPRYESIKKEVLSCKTIQEAQKKVLNLQDLVERYVTPKTKAKAPIVRPSVLKEGLKNQVGEADVGRIKPSGWI